jgi:hypothetical protein
MGVAVLLDMRAVHRAFFSGAGLVDDALENAADRIGREGRHRETLDAFEHGGFASRRDERLAARGLQSSGTQSEARPLVEECDEYGVDAIDILAAA